MAEKNAERAFLLLGLIALELSAFLRLRNETKSSSVTSVCKSLGEFMAEKLYRVAIVTFSKNFNTIGLSTLWFLPETVLLCSILWTAHSFYATYLVSFGPFCLKSPASSGWPMVPCIPNMLCHDALLINPLSILLDMR